MVFNFIAFNDTTLLPGGATVNTASSEVITSTAIVRITAPTAVELANKTVQVVDDQVVSQWTTVTQNNLIGFYLWCESTDGQVMRLTIYICPLYAAKHYIQSLRRLRCKQAGCGIIYPGISSSSW